MALKSKRDNVSASTTIVTTVVVHVDLAALLAAYDVTDNVVLMLATPSGRDKRVVLGGNFLVPPHQDLNLDVEYRGTY
jgi:hypothetical protein